MSFRLSLPRFSGNHVFLGTYRDFNQWKLNPPHSLRNALKPIESSTAIVPTPEAAVRTLRGSGIHGPENTDVLRLILWNNLKHKRPYREIPTKEEFQEWSKLEVSSVWFTWGFLFFYVTMANYGYDYATQHDHMPWVPPRTDGSKGEGPMFWFLE